MRSWATVLGPDHGQKEPISSRETQQYTDVLKYLIRIALGTAPARWFEVIEIATRKSWPWAKPKKLVFVTFVPMLKLSLRGRDGAVRAVPR